MHTANMLSITNEEKNYIGCLSRMTSVVKCAQDTIQILQNEHNSTVKAEEGDSYFQSDKYIYSLFYPLTLKYIDYTNHFSEDFTEENAKVTFANEAGNNEIMYESDSRQKVLKFVNENSTTVFQTIYDKDSDSMRYACTEESNGLTQYKEFADFIKVSDNEYLLSSTGMRCYIRFNDNTIDKIYCSKVSINDIESNMIFDDEASDNFSAENWVFDFNDSDYTETYSFSDGVLTYRDYTTDEMREIEINFSKYESAFYTN